MNMIGIFGMGDTPIFVIKALKKKGISNIIGFPDEIDGKQSWRVSFRQYCRNEGIEFVNLPSAKSDAIIKILKQKNITIIISAHSEIIIPKKVIEYVHGEIFNIHFGLLPKYRGLFPTFWHILNGDECSGVTLHKITSGIDVGDIIDQIQIPITSQTTNWSLYSECKRKSYELMLNNILQLIGKTYKAKRQNDAMSSYYSKKSVNFSENYVNWNLSVEKVSRFIQAFIFPPLQYPRTRYKKEVLEITKILGYVYVKPKFSPGTILSIKNGICSIQVMDGYCNVRFSRSRILRVGERVYY